MSDLVITWPKSRPLESYLEECAKADAAGLVINYRIRNWPDLERIHNTQRARRVYAVHDGAVRGWHTLLSIENRRSGAVVDPITGAPWPAGIYLVRDPEWNPIEPTVSMRGFQGWRYFDVP